jgi:hypothetical protein
VVWLEDTVRGTIKLTLEMNGETDVLEQTFDIAHLDSPFVVELVNGDLYTSDTDTGEEVLRIWWARMMPEPMNEEAEPIDAELVEQLKALGYVE